MIAAAKKKPDAAFVIRLVGPGIRPWAVPLRSLAKVLDAVQRLTEQRDDSVDDDSAGESEVQRESGAILHLLNVKSSSAAYGVAARNQEEALGMLRCVQASIDKPHDADWLDSTLSSVKDMSDIARALNCEIEFCDTGKTGNVIARIAPTTYGEIERTAFIHARTSVYAKIERLGGATEMHCGIRLPNAPRKMVHCRVSNADLVRELGQYMYQEVVLTGQATWLRHNWRLKRIVIDSFEPPKKGSIMEALRRSHEAGGCVWDQIDDPEALIAEMRRS